MGVFWTFGPSNATGSTGYTGVTGPTGITGPAGAGAVLSSNLVSAVLENTTAGAISR